jgi:hypothetical protein
MARDDSENGDTSVGGHVPPARVRPRPNAELGEEFARLLGEPHAHQLGVCGKMGLSYRSYKRWMAADVDEDDCKQDLADFQRIVLSALEDARVRDIEALDHAVDCLQGPDVAKAGAYVNKHTFHHQNRFKRFYANDDEPKKAELDIGNKDGKPFAQHHTGPITEQSRRVIVTEFLGLTPELLDAGAKAGDVDMAANEEDGPGGDDL